MTLKDFKQFIASIPSNYDSIEVGIVQICLNCKKEDLVCNEESGFLAIHSNTPHGMDTGEEDVEDYEADLEGTPQASDFPEYDPYDPYTDEFRPDDDGFEPDPDDDDTEGNC